MFENGTYEDVHKIVRHLWSEVLCLEESSIDEDAHFIQLGGDSLAATILIEEIQKRLSLSIELPVMLEYPTVKQLTEHLLSLTHNNKDSRERLMSAASGEEGII